MRILLWHVHGGYANALVRGPHEYLFPLADHPLCGGMGRPSVAWPSTARDVTPADIAAHPPDLVLIQRLEEIDICEQVLGLRPGLDVRAIFLEHNTPRADVPNTRHPLADAPGWEIVHVTHFNALFWDCGGTPTWVVEHGIPDPGYRYTGALTRQAFVVNEPVRRWRVTGSDLLPRFFASPVDVFGIHGDRLADALGAGADQLAFAGDMAPEPLYAALSQRRVYLHLNRWTSLGLSLLQAMHLGMPVIVLGTTETYRAVPAGAGAISTDIAELVDAALELMSSPSEARRRGEVAREAALQRYGLTRFLQDWDRVFAG